MNLSTNLRASCALATLGWAMLAGAPGTAQAQVAAPVAAEAAPAVPDEAAQGDIVVTGTRIKGIAPVGSPVIGVSRLDVEQSGQNTTADTPVLRAVAFRAGRRAPARLGKSG